MISILHILCKDNANREENEMNLFISYPEMKLILCKDSNSFSIHALYIRKVFFFILLKWSLNKKVWHFQILSHTFLFICLLLIIP